jgi:hypothetical protein
LDYWNHAQKSRNRDIGNAAGSGVAAGDVDWAGAGVPCCPVQPAKQTVSISKPITTAKIFFILLQTTISQLKISAISGKKAIFQQEKRQTDLTADSPSWCMWSFNDLLSDLLHRFKLISFSQLF